ncbi:hypothetical protein ANAEL_02854 [Anaerolineales bacterium]|nr:hypothetical protein ANAEL_02854 [Anaerolineales bacterium]
MNLIDRYVIEVGKHLPLVKGRKDIEKELRSTLEDMLEDHAQKAGRAADETMEIELLKEYGAPEKVAATYNPQPYLIGPRMYPFFLMVLKIVTAVITIVLLVLTGVKIATMSPMAGPEFAKVIGDGLAGIISAVIAAFGNIVLVFAILERFVPAAEFKMDEEKEWDPASLKKEPEPDEVKAWESILAIVFTFIALSIFNYNPQWIGIYTVSGDKWNIIPILTESFFHWLPWINIGWIAEIVLNGILLRTGRWNLATRVFSIGIKIFQVVIGLFLLTGPSILAVTPESLLASGIFDADAAQILGTMAQNGVRGLIGLIIFITMIEVIKASYKLITQNTSTRA